MHFEALAPPPPLRGLRREGRTPRFALDPGGAPVKNAPQHEPLA
jgi:hypothetical protein